MGERLDRVLMVSITRAPLVLLRSKVSYREAVPSILSP